METFIKLKWKEKKSKVKEKKKRDRKNEERNNYYNKHVKNIVGVVDRLNDNGI